MADLSRDDWDEGLSIESYDAVVSTLVLEHLPFDRYKAAIKKCLRLEESPFERSLKSPKKTS